MTYFTAVVGEDGTVKTFGDVYELDNLPAPSPVPSEDASSAPSTETPSGVTPQSARKPINGSFATTSP
jgi:hypothetical protein